MINPNNNNEKRFKRAVTAALYHEEIDKDPNTHQRQNIMKTNATRMDLCFHWKYKI